MLSISEHAMPDLCISICVVKGNQGNSVAREAMKLFKVFQCPFSRLLACGQLICAVILCLWLPETRGRELEEINS